jgi:hypothetical protein
MSILKETTEVLGHLLEAMPSDSLFAIREEAASFLREKGIPSKRHEDWKYTNIKRLFDNGLSPIAGTRDEETSGEGVIPAPTVQLSNSSVSKKFSNAGWCDLQFVFGRE